MSSVLATPNEGKSWLKTKQQMKVPTNRRKLGIFFLIFLNIRMKKNRINSNMIIIPLPFSKQVPIQLSKRIV
jgi:hypothetical protein